MAISENSAEEKEEAECDDRKGSFLYRVVLLSPFSLSPQPWFLPVPLGDNTSKQTELAEEATTVAKPPLSAREEEVGESNASREQLPHKTPEHVVILASVFGGNEGFYATA